MIAAEIIGQVLDAGGRIAADGADLVLTAPRPLPPDLLDRLKAHKPAVMEALSTPATRYAVPLAAETSAPDPLWARVAITEPGGRTIEVDTPSGRTLADWQAYAERYHGPGCAVTAVLPLPKPRAPVNLDEALRAACEGVAGITSGVFRSLLSPEDLDDIAAGDIHRKTLKAYAQSFAEGILSGRIAVLPRVAS